MPRDRAMVEGRLKHALSRAESVDADLRLPGSAAAGPGCADGQCVFHPRAPASLSAGYAGEARALLAMLAMRRSEDGLLEFALFAVCPFCEKLAVAEAAVRANVRHPRGV